MSSIFVTHANQSSGPGIVRALVAHRYHVVCHDPSFTNKGAREDFARETKTYAIAAQSPEDIYKEVSSIGDVDRFVFHQPSRDSLALNEDDGLDTLSAVFDALMVFPFRLNQLFLPELKIWKRGAIVFIASVPQLKPESEHAVSNDMLADSLAFISALAEEAEPFGIQVNALQTIFRGGTLSSPKGALIVDVAGTTKTVLAGRTGTPEEFCELVVSFISRKSPFNTGQEIQFAGS